MRYTLLRNVRFGTVLIVMSALLSGTSGLAQQASPGSDTDAIEKAKGLSRAFRAAAKQVIPTVVKIKTTTRPKQIQQSEGRMPQRPNPFQGTPFEDFFNEQTPGLQFHGNAPQREGLGSGVIIDAKGIVLTNHHVVDGADEVLVELSDGRQFKGTEIKSDEQSDLAVVRIKADGSLPAATLGDSDKLEIGDWVLAIGNPFDLDLTVSAGIISGKSRILPSGRRAEFLQTDAAINPGNSGGPLVNLEGEVVGINTAIASNSGGYQGVGFAIPVNLAKWVSKQLINAGAVQRAYLGVKLELIDAPLAEKLGLRPGEGVLVAEVFPDTPAAKAGIKEGDVIVAYAGHAVHSPRQLQEVVEKSPLGSSQQLQVKRDGKPLTLPVVASALPKDFGMAMSPGRGRSRGADAGAIANKELGIEVTDLTKDLAERWGYNRSSGAVITSVDNDSVAGQAGVRPGMLVLRLGKKEIRSAADFAEAMKGESLQRGVLLLVRDPQGGNRFLVLRKA